jgi:hypothetical protein
VEFTFTSSMIDSVPNKKALSLRRVPEVRAIIARQGAGSSGSLDLYKKIP